MTHHQDHHSGERQTWYSMPVIPGRKSTNLYFRTCESEAPLFFLMSSKRILFVFLYTFFNLSFKCFINLSRGRSSCLLWHGFHVSLHFSYLSPMYFSRPSWRAATTFMCIPHVSVGCTVEVSWWHAVRIKKPNLTGITKRKLCWVLSDKSDPLSRPEIPISQTLPCRIQSVVLLGLDNLL